MKINIFETAFAKPRLEDGIEIDEFLEGVKLGRWQKAAQKILLSKSKEEKDRHKKNTPGVTLSGWFEGKRSINTLRQHSGFICIDLDHVENLEECFQTLKNSEYTYALFRSISGKGLAWVVKIDPLKHREAFDALSQYVFSLTGANADPACKDVSRLRFVSFDPNLFQNANSKVFKQYLKKETKKEYAQRTGFPDLDRFDELVSKINTDITGDYHQWLKIGFAIAAKYGASGEHYFQRISSFSGEYDEKKTSRQYQYCCRNFGASGVQIGTFYYYAKQAGFEAYDKKEKAIITQAVRASKGHADRASAIRLLEDIGQIELTEQNKELLDKAYEKPDQFTALAEADGNGDFNIDALEDYIKTVWSIKKNELTQFIEIEDKRATPEDINSIFISCKKAFPGLTDAIFNRLMRSNFIKKYNPIKDYLNHLQWDGQDRVTPLAESLRSCTMDIDYQSKMLVRWLLGFMQNIYSNKACPLMLVLVGKKNTGKSYFFEELLPKRFRGYFGTSQHDREKDDDLLMTQKWLILDDEFSGKSKQDAKKMKRLLSTSYFDIRPPYGAENVQLKRIAVLAGTCNEMEILNDPTGNRRFIVFDIQERMDWDLFNSIDKGQLLAQIKTFWDAGFTGDLKSSEIELLESATSSKHSEVSIEEELILKYYMPPTDGLLEAYTNTEIKVHLEKMSNQKLSSRKLGLELRKLGYKVTNVRRGGHLPCRAYLIATTFSAGDSQC